MFSSRKQAAPTTADTLKCCICSNTGRVQHDGLNLLCFGHSPSIQMQFRQQHCRPQPTGACGGDDGGGDGGGGGGVHPQWHWQWWPPLTRHLLEGSCRHRSKSGHLCQRPRSARHKVESRDCQWKHIMFMTVASGKAGSSTDASSCRTVSMDLEVHKLCKHVCTLAERTC